VYYQPQFVGHYFTSDPGVTETYSVQQVLIGCAQSVSHTIFFICETLTAVTACGRASSFRESCTANHCCEGPLMASNKSDVAHVTGDAAAVHPQHGEKSTSSSMSISTTEPMEIIDITSECFFTSCSVYVNMISPLL